MGNENELKLPPKPEDLLVALAKRHFAEDWNEEVDFPFFQNIARGEIYDVRSNINAFNFVANAEYWPQHRILNASRITWLCNNTQAKIHVPSFGIHIKGCYIKGHLFCRNIKIEFPLWFEKSYISNYIDIQYAHMESFLLQGSYCQTILATGLLTTGSIFLRNGFKAHGPVELAGATIGGQLDCTNAKFHFESEEKCALNASLVNVKASVILQDGFEANGKVSFEDAIIEGQFNCVGATFLYKHEEYYAFNLDSVHVNGCMRLGHNFKAFGQVLLRGCTIEGHLDCSGGKFLHSSEQGYALNADALHVKGDVFLRDDFEAHGQVTLRGGHIEGQLSCQGAKFLYDSVFGHSLFADALYVKQALIIRDFEAHGKVDFTHAQIDGGLQIVNLSHCPTMSLCLRFATAGIFQDNAKGWPESGGLDLHGFRYKSISKSAPTDFESRIKWINLQTNIEYNQKKRSQEINTFLKEDLSDIENFKQLGLLLEKDKFSLQYYNKIKCSIKENIKTEKASELLCSLLKVDEFDPQPYEQLALVLNKMGHKEDAIEIGIEKEQVRARYHKQNKPKWFKRNDSEPNIDNTEENASQLSFSDFWTSCKDLSLWWIRCFWNKRYENMVYFGYRPFRRTLWRLFVLLLIGWVFYGFSYQQNIMSPTRKHADTVTVSTNGGHSTPIRTYGNLDLNEDQLYPNFQAFFYSADALIPLVDFGQTDYWQPNTFADAKPNGDWGFWRFSMGGFVLFFMYFQIVAGWMLTSFIVAGIAGLVRKQDG